MNRRLLGVVGGVILSVSVSACAVPSGDGGDCEWEQKSVTSHSMTLTKPRPKPKPQPNVAPKAPTLGRPYLNRNSERRVFPPKPHKKPHRGKMWVLDCD